MYRTRFMFLLYISVFILFDFKFVITFLFSLFIQNCYNGKLSVEKHIYMLIFYII